MDDLLKKAIERYFRRIVDSHHVALLVASLVVTALAVVVVATQWNINSDFQELLPGDSEAAQAMEEVGQRVGSASSLFVVVDSPDREANREFARVFAEQLREHDDVALAHFHNDKTFFEEHKLLYADTGDLEELLRQVQETIREEKQRQNPLYADLGGGDDDESIDTDEIEERYEQQAHQDYREYLEAEDGYSLTIVVRFADRATDLETTRRLLDEVKALGEQLEPSRYHEEMTLEYGGGLVHRQGQYTSIVDDIQLSAVFTIAALFLVLALYFRRFRAVGLVLIPLVMAVLWTFAASFLLFGELTTISVFVFAILLGLGIDFSIHLLNGYDRARLAGDSPIDALVESYGSVGRATIMGGVTTFATFVVLSFAQFRGLSQFGIVSAIGVLMMVAGVLVTLPALIMTLQGRWPYTPNPDRRISKWLPVQKIVQHRTLGKAAPWLLGVAAVLLVAAGWQIPDLQFEENFRQIGEVTPPWERMGEKSDREKMLSHTRRQARRNAEHIEERALEVRETVDPESFAPDRQQMTTGEKYTSALRRQHSSTPTLLLADSIEDAATVYERMDAAKRAGGLKTVRSITSIHAFMPGDIEEQQRRLEIISEIEETLEDEDIEAMSDDARQQLQRLQSLIDVDEPVTIYDMPMWAKRMFREAGPEAFEPAEGEEFAFEYVVYVNEAIDNMIGSDARRFLREVRRSAEAGEGDVRIASQSYIYTAMLDEIRYDGGKMLGIALLLVLALLTLYFRHPLRAMVALLPLTVGAIWMFGFAIWFGLKLDFFNVVILPVIIGVGIDDGLHFYHRYLDRGRGSIAEVFHHVGAAVGMTTVTSAIGFGGLAITDYPGLQSIGYLAIIGLVCTFVATLLILPALLWVAEQREWDWMLPDESV